MKLQFPARHASLMTPAARLLRYRHDDLLEDITAEVADVLALAPAEAARQVRATLALYPGALPADVPRQAAEAIVEFTGPHRLPHMTARLDAVLQRLREYPALRTVLDYGGGGGKDSIIYAGAGYAVTYSDLLGPLTPFVEARFRLRGLPIGITDTRDLGDRRFDIVNCLDVIEHIYDVEHALADMVARLNPGGHLICYPAFFNSWNGDHVEKNCGYLAWFPRLLEHVGLVPAPGAPWPPPAPSVSHKLGLRVDDLPVLHALRAEGTGNSVAEDRDALRERLYQRSCALSGRAAARSLAVLPMVSILTTLPFARLRTKAREKRRMLLDDIIDNLGIRRLADHRLREATGRPVRMDH